MSKNDEDATFARPDKNPMRLINTYHRLIHKYSPGVKLMSRVCVYRGFELVHKPILYHRLNKNVYNETKDAILLNEDILDDLIERGVNDIIYVDYHADYGFGDHISASTTYFINDGEVSKGKVYLPIEYFDYLGTEYINYIPRFNQKSDKNDYSERNQRHVPSECDEGRQTEENHPLGDQEEPDLGELH